ncbi:MAG: fatty-acid synthase [Deltaproteobacteria bacterium]|nr:MAG: fatty-acid synthase [Deltaproteobacteria bacterium]TMQ13599.1 MAG: fatty-acid synthase [Deltaproteobacteria bacterium]
MPARDHLHNVVRNVLTSDGWTITHDPLHLVWGKRDVYADLGAERFVGAQKGPIRIAVEIKSFSGPSPIDALEKALGQFTLYHDILARVEPDRELFLAVSDMVYSEIFEEAIGQLLLANERLKLLVFNPETEVIEQWTPEPPTAR